MTAIYGLGHCAWCGLDLPLTTTGCLSWHADWRNPDQACGGSMAYAARINNAPPSPKRDDHHSGPKARCHRLSGGDLTVIERDTAKQQAPVSVGACYSFPHGIRTETQSPRRRAQNAGQIGAQARQSQARQSQDPEAVARAVPHAPHA